MIVLGVINGIGLLACLVGFTILLKRGSHLPGRKIVITLLCWIALYSCSTTLEWIGVRTILDPYENYIQIITPVLWAGLFYMMLMESEMSRRRESERQLRESEERLSLAAEGARIGIWDLQIQTGEVTINEEWASILGYTLEELAPLDITQWERICHPDDMVTSRHLFEEHLAGKTDYYEGEARVRQKNGNWIWVMVRGKIVASDLLGFPLRMSGTHHDITRQKLAEAALRVSEEKFAKLFQLSPDAVALVQMTPPITLMEVNEAFTHLFGRDKQALEGCEAAQLGLFEDRETLETLVKAVTTEHTLQDREVIILGANNAPTPCSLSCKLLFLEDSLFMLAVFRDISDTRRMQEMMVQTEKMLSVGGIAAGIAHEINNPLGIVLQAAQNMTQRLRPDFPKNIKTAQEVGCEMDQIVAYMRTRSLDVFIDDIQTAAGRAAEITRHMLDFSRPSETRRKACDMPTIVRKALTLAQSDYDLKKQYDFKKIQVNVTVGDDLPAINCSETEIEQVLLNLLRNAAQAMASAEPPIMTPRIDVRLAARRSSLRIAVEDNGPGLPPAIRGRVFEPFFTTKAPGVGTGLGLSVSYFIITTGHGGKMHVISPPGGGTRFVIELPIEEEES